MPVPGKRSLGMTSSSAASAAVCAGDGVSSISSTHRRGPAGWSVLVVSGAGVAPAPFAQTPVSAWSP